MVSRISAVPSRRVPPLLGTLLSYLLQLLHHTKSLSPSASAVDDIDRRRTLCVPLRLPIVQIRRCCPAQNGVQQQIARCRNIRKDQAAIETVPQVSQLLLRCVPLQNAMTSIYRIVYQAKEKESLQNITLHHDAQRRL